MLFNNQNILAHYFGNNLAGAIYYNEVQLFPTSLVFTVDTRLAAPTNTFDLLTVPSTHYDFSINWGDGSTERIITTNSKGFNHTYATPGIYTITISTTSLSGFSRPYFFGDNFNNLSAFKVTSINSLGFLQNTDNLSYAWAACRNLSSIPNTGYPSCTSFFYTWRRNTELKVFPLVDTSKGQDFYGAWFDCTSLSEFPVLDFTKATTMRQAWQNCTNLRSFPFNDTFRGNNLNLFGAWSGCLNLTSFNTTNFYNATNFRYAWEGCEALTNFPNISAPNALTFANAWVNCKSLRSFNTTNFPKVNDLTNAWSGCTSLTSFQLTAFPAGTDFSFAWFNCQSFTNFPAISAPQAIAFDNAWKNCINLTNFPSITAPVVYNFNTAWFGCTSLRFFPNIFNIRTTTETTNLFGTFALTNLTSVPLLTGTLGLLNLDQTFVGCAALSNANLFTNIPWNSANQVFDIFANISLTVESYNNLLSSLALSSTISNKDFGFFNARYSPSFQTYKTTLTSRGVSAVDRGIYQDSYTFTGPIDIMLIAGGGGGGSEVNDHGGGGGGAGGVILSSINLQTGTYRFIIGAGGAQNTAGTNTVLSASTGLINLTAFGGGRGGTNQSVNQILSGGSGGGVSFNQTTPLTGSVLGQGFPGGDGLWLPVSTGSQGGGGGAGGTGGDGNRYQPTSTVYNGFGGTGILTSIDGTLKGYAGGGAAGASRSWYSRGSIDGGGRSSEGISLINGGVNTGGGGAGGSADSYIGPNRITTNGGNGGSGIAVIRYTTGTRNISGGTITVSGPQTIHVFTTTGTLTAF